MKKIIRKWIEWYIEREGQKMIVALITIIVLCFLGLLACCIVLLIDDVREYKWRKRMKERWMNDD